MPPLRGKTEEDELYDGDRQQMVTRQIEARGIREQRLLEALQQIPRHVFVPKSLHYLAYTDGPLPIGDGQTISQPYIVALMTDLLKLKGDEVVLEIGTGSGYQAAILAKLAKHIYTIERNAQLANKARQTLDSLGLDNISVIVGDGSLGLPEHAPYQGIVVTAAAPEAPPPLLDQLDDGGRLVIPIGAEYGQYLHVYVRSGERYESRPITPVAFVPMRGKYGWSKSEWAESERGPFF
jgi:protein-L-isoaspartate(D-aspartate) O-methyltransferase